MLNNPIVIGCSHLRTTSWLFVLEDSTSLLLKRVWRIRAEGRLDFYYLWDVGPLETIWGQFLFSGGSIYKTTGVLSEHKVSHLLPWPPLNEFFGRKKLSEIPYLPYPDRDQCSDGHERKILDPFIRRFYHGENHVCQLCHRLHAPGYTYHSCLSF